MAIKSFLRFVEDTSLVSKELLKQEIKKNLGHDKFKDKSGLFFQVLVDDINRIDLLKQIEKLFSEFGARYDPQKGSSSVGAVVIGRYSIGAAPLSKQGKRSAGLDNEDTLVKQLNEFLKNGPMHIRFEAGASSFTVENVKIAKEVGRDTSGRKKSDVDLITTDRKKVPLSLKKDNAEMWESADSYYAKQAREIIDHQVSLGKAKLEDRGGNLKRISPNIAKPATKKETKDVVFGSDILRGGGAVLYRTFSSSDFKIDPDGETIIVKISKIYRTVQEVERSDQAVFFLIRNDSSRKWSKIYPGIRVLAVGKSRINKRILVVS